MNTTMHQMTEWRRLRAELLPLLQARAVSEAHLSTASRLAVLFGETRTLVILALALALRAPGTGSMRTDLLGPSALDLKAEWNLQELSADALRILALEGRREWLALVRSSPAVMCVSSGGQPEITEVRPFVCTSDGHLYVHRYWQYEQQIAAHLVGLAGTRHEWTPNRSVTGLRSLTSWLRASLSPGVQSGTTELSSAAEQNLAKEPDAQDVAVATGILSSLLVLTGGPGTGKTSTVRNLITALHLGHHGERPLRVVVAAPTGKAAARVKESLGVGLDHWSAGLEGAMRRPDSLPDHEVIRRIRVAIESQPCLTLHRLLGWQRRDPSRFRHDRLNPLPYDVVIVDEASMVDALLMAKLLDAIPPDARLVLMGDRNQLSSVDVGTVLGDICLSALTSTGGIGVAGARADVRALLGMRALADTPVARPVAECTVELLQSHRFDAEKPIGQLALSIQSGSACWADQTPSTSLRAVDGVVFVNPMAGARPVQEPRWKLEQRVYRLAAGTLLQEAAISGYADYMTHMRSLRASFDSEVFEGKSAAPATPITQHEVALRQAFSALNQYRILCSHRDHPWGVVSLNEQLSRLIREEIRRSGSRSAQTDDESRPVRAREWWHGRAIMVLRNDYSLQLFNGDVGITLGEGSSAVVVFPSEQGGFRTLAPAMLPEHETAFALTVHKSQGSEFTRILLVLPPGVTELLTRELVYTALTRAKTGAAIYGSPESFDAACARRVARASGVRELLER